MSSTAGQEADRCDPGWDKYTRQKEASARPSVTQNQTAEAERCELRETPGHLLSADPETSV